MTTARPKDNAALGNRFCFPVGPCLLLLLGLLAAGCHSVYHRARQGLPPDPCAELKLRIEESRAAERAARAAAAQWRGSVEARRDADAVATDLDRIELTARELARRASIAHDATRRCPEAAQESAETARLARLAGALVEWVVAARQPDGPGVGGLVEILGPAGK